MEIIRKAGVLYKKNLIELENHSLDKNYGLYSSWTPRKKVTKLMLLIDFTLSKKYCMKMKRHTLINLIEEYIKEVPDEINYVDERGWSALILSIEVNSLEIMSILLKSDIVDINSKDDQEWTASHYASHSTNTYLFKLLAEYDADLSIKDRHGRTPENLDYTSKMIIVINNIALLNIKN